jgi:hypothetical protein
MKNICLFAFILSACGDQTSVTDGGSGKDTKNIENTSTKVKIDLTPLLEKECVSDKVVEHPFALNCAHMCVKYPEKEYMWCKQFDTYCLTEKGYVDDKKFCEWWAEKNN